MTRRACHASGTPDSGGWQRTDGVKGVPDGHQLLLAQLVERVAKELLARRARIALGTATQCTRRNDSPEAASQWC
jgi:hypothetical protein